jgi:hypothetical protein
MTETDPMILKRAILAAGLLAATGTHAHETIGRHGGRVADAGDFHVELVTRGATVDVFVSDGAQRPVAATGFEGTAILVVGGRPARVPLQPVEGNRLTGKAAEPLGERPKGAVRLTGPNGAAASGKFD